MSIHKTATLMAALLAFGALAEAQTPSGLLTGPVTYTSSLTSGNPYGDTHVWTVKNPDGTTYTCSALGTPSCYIVQYVVGAPYQNLQASDDTGNCYSWDVWQLRTDGNPWAGIPPCQDSFIGGAPGEYGALYCASTTSSDMNGQYGLSCTAGWNGTAVTPINGVNTPIATTYKLQVSIAHHPVTVWIPAYYHTPGHWATWQQIDSAAITVTPQLN